MKFAPNAVTRVRAERAASLSPGVSNGPAKTTTHFAARGTQSPDVEARQVSGFGGERIGRQSETGIGEAPGKRAFDNASFFRVLGVFHFKQRFLLMATDPPETGPRSSGEDLFPEAGEGTEDFDPSRSTKVLRREIDARDSELAELGDAANKRQEELRRESTRQTAYFEESLNRLQRELQEQSIESAERIRELKAEIEHLKITRFQAKRENYSIKTSLSWRLTWPLRVLRDAGAAFVHKSRARFGLVFEPRPAPGASQTMRIPPRASRRELMRVRFPGTTRAAD